MADDLPNDVSNRNYWVEQSLCKTQGAYPHINNQLGNQAI